MPPSIINPSPQQCLALLPKLNDADADIRYMSLNDLWSILNAGAPTFLYPDYHTSAKVIDGIIHSLDDQNGEVQNQAIKCVGALVIKLPPDILAPFIHRISNIKTTHSVDSAIHTTALRTILASFPPPVPGLPLSDKTNDAYIAISKTLIPRLLGSPVAIHTADNHGGPTPSMLELGSEKGVNGDAFDVLTDVIRCFGPILKDAEKQALEAAILITISDDRTSSVVKKKAVVAISILSHYLPDSLLKSLIAQLLKDAQVPDLALSRRRLLLSIIGALSRSIPQRLGLYLKNLAPIVLSALSEKEYQADIASFAEGGDPNSESDDVRETALIALEGLLTCCTNDMRPFTNDSVAAGLRYIAYDPNAASEENDESMDDSERDEDDELEESDDVDEDFEQENAFSDDEDSSWKIRRCAAKVLYAIIATRSHGDLLDNGVLYERIAPVLVKRFAEREENVRLEVVHALALLVRKTGEEAAPGTIPLLDAGSPIDQVRRSRKRRRVDSNVETLAAAGALASAIGLSSPAASPSPITGPRAELARLSPKVTKAISSVFKQTSVPTKQAAISLLRDIVLVLQGGLSESLSRIMKPLIDIVGLPAGTALAPASSAAATGASMRIEALQLVASISDTHSSRLLSSYVASIVASTAKAIDDGYYKIRGEALLTSESVIKLLTPPRSAGEEGTSKKFLENIFDHLLTRASPDETDLEVKQKAIHALGILLARTFTGSKTQLLAVQRREVGLECLKDRLKNETTRLAAVKAMDLIFFSNLNQHDLQPTWVHQVALELAAQLRKADRNLRTSSLFALQGLVSNAAALNSLDDQTILELTAAILPLINSQDLNLLTVTLSILRNLVEIRPKKVMTANVVQALCQVLKSPLGGKAFNAFLSLVQTIGESGAGQPLMHAFLQDIGVSGDPASVGKAIGTLLTTGGSTVGVNLKDFETELKSAKDPQRQCLALSVLGEAGYRLGAGATLKPQMFTQFFQSESDIVSRAAALALGRAGAGNVSAYLPVILQNLQQSGNTQYLSLYSVKEILQSASSIRGELAPYSKQIWDGLIAASQTEDTRTLGSECIGRIAIVEPATYLTILQEYLKDLNASVRGMTIQAIRCTFSDSDDSFDEFLKPQLVNMLAMMLNDPNVDNRRLALGTLNTAVIHKSEMILPHLTSLIPSVMKDSKIDQDLIREVQMGPFRHKVDDGLELRKSAYETLFSLMDHAFSRMNPTELSDRIISGLDDEHDIKMICSLMLNKLVDLNPDEVVRRLGDICERLRVILSFKPKENAVKQEMEKATEASKAALMVTIRLKNGVPAIREGAPGDTKLQQWKAFWDWLQKEHRPMLALAESEYKSQGA